MATNLKVSFIFDTGKRIKQSDIEALSDGIIDLLKRQFPLYSGTCLSIGPVDDNGDPIKPKVR